MKIHITSAPKRAKTKSGDLKFVKGVTYVRRQVRVQHGPHRGAYVISGSRPVYEWVKA
jgi:hypothetical protein